MGNLFSLVFAVLMIIGVLTQIATAQVMGPVRPASIDPAPSDSQESYTPAQVRLLAPPSYTDDARQLHVEGLVIVRVTVNPNGSPGDMKVIRGLGYGLDEEALASLRVSKFSAAIRNGTSIQESIDVAVTFRLR